MDHCRGNLPTELGKATARGDPFDLSVIAPIVFTEPRGLAWRVGICVRSNEVEYVHAIFSCLFQVR
jgi:hypothetical protein